MGLRLGGGVPRVRWLSVSSAHDAESQTRTVGRWVCKARAWADREGINSWVYDVGMARREVKDGGPEKYSRQAQRHGWSRPMDGDGDLCV